MQPALMLLRNPKFQKVVLGVLLVLADVIATELTVKKPR
jgi:hypothetical protein